MLNTYEGILNNGHITWLDSPPIANNTKVYVTVIENSEQPPITERKLDFMRGEMTMPDEIADDDPDWYPKAKRIGMSAGKAKFPDDINKYDDEVARLFGVEL